MSRKRSDLGVYQEVLLNVAELRAILLALDVYTDTLRQQSQHRQAAGHDDSHPERAHILSAGLRIRTALRQSIATQTMHPKEP